MMTRIVMQPRPRLWPGALARLLAFVGIGIIAGAAVAASWLWLAPGAADPMWGDTTVMAGGALAAGAIMIRVADHRPVGALGVGISRMTARHVLMGTAIGGAGLVAAAAALLVTGSLGYTGDGGTAAHWLITVGTDLGLFTLAAFAEEALFRGYPFQVLVYAAGAPAAIILTSAGFALAHGANPDVSVFALINIGLAGVLLAVAYLKTLSLWFATALHMGWNWSMATLFDLPVSGIKSFDTPLYEPVIGGAAWWSGGAFGPEGGLVGVLGFTVALIVVWRWRAVQPDPAIAAARPLVIVPATMETGNDG